MELIGITQLSPIDVERVLDACSDKPRTCNYVHTVLRRALNTAVKWETRPSS